jgi:UDP-3-O-[3-hydroxymyristoyl] glucosamine N-acyltransferase
VEITLEQLAVMAQGVILRGDPQMLLTGIAALREAGAGDLSFYGNERYINDLRRTRAGAVLVPENTPQDVCGAALVACVNPSAAFAEVVKRFRTPPREFRPGIHPAAVVHPAARLDPSRVCIGPCAVVEAGVEIGDGTEIGPGCMVGENAKIGRDCVLFAGAVIYHHCLVGDRVRLHSGAVIGSDGFGYEFIGGRHEKIDQVGIVQIDSDVEIGANTTVDRARFGRTWIGEGCKIDNQVQIAHNVVLGRHVIVVAQAGIAGSSRVGDYTVIAAQAGIAGHLEVGPQITIAGKAGVTRDLTEKGVYAGHPVQPMREHQRQQVLVRQLADLAARLKTLEEQAGE